MKNSLLLLILSVCITLHAYSQAAIEVQAGGADFLGISVNSRYGIGLGHNQFHRLTPSFGIGILAPELEANTLIVNAGINYSYKSFGIGTEVSGFTTNPFSSSTIPSDFVDMIIYPNLNYMLNFKTRFYLRFSVGAYFAYSKFADPVSEKTYLRFEGDVLPGIGIGFGYKFH